MEIYKLGEKLDSFSSPKEQEQILAVLEKGNSLILDMTDCTYVSSAGLRVLLYSYKVAVSNGQKLYLVGVCEEVRDVMGMTGFEDYFEFFGSIDECLQQNPG